MLRAELVVGFQAVRLNISDGLIRASRFDSKLSLRNAARIATYFKWLLL
jgi:hypothetical protein